MSGRFSFAAAFVALLGSVSAQVCAPAKTSEPTMPAPIRQVVFENAPLLSAQARQEIAKVELEQTVRAASISADMSSLAEEASERVRAAYQDNGYFKVQVTANAVPVAEDASARYDIVTKVLEEGQQYRLGDLRIIHMTVFPETHLRDLFPVQRGEIFSREQVTNGLEKLRRLYGGEGYINFTEVPNTIFDDDNRSIGLEIDVDEGRQFRLRSVEVLGVDSETRARVLNDLDMKLGDIFSSEAWERSLLKFHELSQNQEPNAVDKRLDESGGWVDMVLDFRKPRICSRSSYSGPPILASEEAPSQ